MRIGRARPKEEAVAWPRLRLAALALLVAVLAGCAAMEAGFALYKHKGRVLRIVPGAAGELVLSTQMNYDATMRHFVESNGQPDYIYVPDNRTVIVLYIDRDLAVLFERQTFKYDSRAILREGVPEPFLADLLPKDHKRLLKARDARENPTK